MQKLFLLLFCVAVLFTACLTGIDKSEEPGILRVTLQADPTDTTITILGRDYGVDTTSVFYLHVFEAKAYIESDYTFLVPSLELFHDEGRYYNILEMENNTYKKYTIYESFVPPARYTRFQFGLTSEMMKIGEYTIPVKIPEEENLLLDFDFEYEVSEHGTTEINLQIAPFASVRRYRDSYIFQRDVIVSSVKRY